MSAVIYLGSCMTLANATRNIGTSGGATGVWNPTSAVSGSFVVHHPAGAACGGSNTTPFAVMTITPCNCMKVRVTISGTGGDLGAAQQALAPGFGADVLILVGGGGGAHCSTKPLVGYMGSPTSREYVINPEQPLEMKFLCSSDNSYLPASTCTFLVEVIYS